MRPCRSEPAAVQHARRGRGDAHRHRARLTLVSLLSGLLLVSAIPSPAFADSTEDQLHALQAQENSQRATLKELAAQQRAALQRLAALRGELSAKQADINRLNSEARDLENQI